MKIKSDYDILVENDFVRDRLWYYFRGCPEIRIYIRIWNSATVFIEHKQKDSENNWTEERDGPELYSDDSSLFDMLLTGIQDALIGKVYSGGEAIFIDELPESSQKFIIDGLHLGEYVRRR